MSRRITLRALAALLVTTAFAFAPAAFAASITFSDSTMIEIPGSGSSGTASPYPSTINVAGVTDTVTDVNVTLNGLSHSYPDDIIIILQGPTGQALYLMDDAGGGGDVYRISVVFDDEAAGPIPDGGPLASGSYQVSQYGAPDFMPAPAPQPGFGGNLALFDGLDPNGAWKLFVYDDAGGDTGKIKYGWSLTFNTDVNPVPEPTAAVLFGLGSVVVGGTLRRRR